MAAIESWLTEGPKASALDGTVLADTGPADEGFTTLQVSLLIASSVAARVDLELRDDTNTISIRTVPIFVVAAQTFQTALTAGIVLGSGQRLRLITNGAVLGTIGGSIFTQ